MVAAMMLSRGGVNRNMAIKTMTFVCFFLFISCVESVLARSEFEAVFRPAFDPESCVSIVRDGPERSLVFSYGDVKSKIRLTQSFSIDQNICDEFFRQIDILLTQKQVKRKVGFDGILVEGTYTAPGRPPVSFGFWSPRKGSSERDFLIIAAFFRVLDSLKVSDSMMMYVEWLRVYFDDLGLPAKIFPGNPYKVRFYGMLSLRNEQQLRGLIHALPGDVQIIVDMSNFHSMGTLLYPIFRELMSKNRNIKWIASGTARSQLIEIGVDANDIQD